MTMINRRQFIYLGATGAAMFAAGLEGQAAGYDLVVKGGRVVDPSLRINALLDIGVTAGRIAAVEANIAPGTAQVIDAKGKVVLPGLIDIHTHYARDDKGPHVGLSDGVTGWIDAGSNGADNIAPAVAIAKGSPQLGRLLINIGRAGIATGGDTTDLARADVNAAKDAISRNREFVIGVKARLSKDVAGPNDVEVLRRAQQVATPFNIPVMIHMGQTVSPLPKLMELLKPGDIVTHMFAPPPNAIIDDSGRLLPEVLAARRRGVWFDVGNGRGGHIRWDVVDRVMQQGFWPDALSTDANTTSRTTGVIDYPNVMSKFLACGMTLDQIVACATVNSARMFPAFSDKGTLNVGAQADIAILELREGSFDFLDNYEGKRNGRQRLFPSDTIVAGKRAPRA
jgi:dihydroorotase